MNEQQRAEDVDEYGNPVDGDRVIYCCFPDCGCDGARLCMAEKGAGYAALSLNFERGTRFGQKRSAT